MSKILVLDGGGRLAQTVARAVRDLGIYAEILPARTLHSAEQWDEAKGVILTGGSDFGAFAKSIGFTRELWNGKLPVLGVGFGIDLSPWLPEGAPSLNRAPGAAANDAERKVLEAFLFQTCQIIPDWNMEAFVERTVADIRRETNGRNVLVALSGGVDSAVAAVLAHRAAEGRLRCLFVDTGLMRKDEGDEVERVFRGQFSVNLIRVDAKERFLARLAGVSDPEQKRRIIGEEFIRVFEEEAEKLGSLGYLVQGTIYPDILESGIGEGAAVKSHHNVGGLPEHIAFTGLIEPLKLLFKEEVRRCGLVMGLPEKMVRRQPFPGPGLAVRVIGALTAEKLDIVREADAIFREEVEAAGLSGALSQYFAVLTDMRSVGVRDGARSYDYTVALRAITTADFMKAKWARLPYDLLERVSGRIVSECKQVNRVVYDVTGKPPATIEWE